MLHLHVATTQPMEYVLHQHAGIAQGAGTAGRSQWKAQGMGRIWSLLTPEGPFALFPSSWVVPGLLLRVLSSGKGERQEMGNARAGTEP